MDTRNTGGQFTEEQIQMTINVLCKCLPSLVIKEM